MTNLHLRFSLLFVLVLLVGCQPSTPEACVEAKLKLMEQVVKIVKKVDDLESANAAEAKFQALVEKGELLDERLKKMDEPSEERIKKMQVRFQTRSRELKKQIQDHMFEWVNRTGDVETNAALTKSFRAARDLGF